ncbi:uncharacterized protein LOC133744687 [Rosa rugosa]|uniref:uncharacterized protein LOC133744687 n=1 Tax=Rosa rugosa TaxID=74645 RepID=UPI002B407823|nr:uncharacterized protein LOC133744687 [Rosa rugosa]
MNEIWKLNIPPKVKIFFKVKIFAWLLSRGRLKTKTRIASFCDNNDTVCQLCRLGDEDLNHVFFSCPFASGVWQNAGINIYDFSSFDAWFLSWFRKGYHKVNTENLIVLCWKIWEARNNLIFRQKTVSPIMVVHAAATLEAGFRDNNLVRDTFPLSHYGIIKWTPPPPGVFKLNFDGSVRDKNKAAAGFVIRDHDANPIFAGSRSFGSSSVPIAEGSALRDGLYHAFLLKCKKLIVEGDSKLIIDAAKNNCTVPWRLRTLFKDIWFLSSQFEEVAFIHIPREANLVADAVTNHAHSSPTPTTWKQKLPFSAFSAFNFDYFSSSCSRGFAL